LVNGARSAHARPVLIGGGAVEFYIGGAVASGDFDVVTGARAELEQALFGRGFVRPAVPGSLRRGLVHPGSGMSVAVVSGRLFDGHSDVGRIRIIELASGESLNVPPVEDMIADRMGQFNARAGDDADMLAQALVLYRVSRENLEIRLDEAYLHTRIRAETLGDYGSDSLRETANG
jgi:hypothetical protein